ncbi:MAG: pentapeptide repeat-containing protein [Xenococcaceae cyanobacterium]
MNSQNREQEIFSRLIKELRSSRNLSQREFSQLFSPRVTYQAIGQWERGEATPARKYWKTLAELAGMELGQFYEYVGVGSTSASSLLEDIIMKIKSLTPSELKEVIEVTVDQSSLLGANISSANSHHLAMLRKGVRAWNKWRDKNPHIIPQLSGIDLLDEKCHDLSGYNLDYANLADVYGYSISFENASLAEANLEGAKFNSTVFSGAYLAGANLKNVELDNVWLMKADLTQANLQEAYLRFANLENANMYMADLSGAEGVRVNLTKAFLKKANLRGVILVNSVLKDANLNEASLEKATLTDCSLYGVSLWGTKVDEVKLKDVYISSEEERGLPIEDLALAQTIYLHRHNPSLTQKFIQVCQMEEEAINLANILVNKYGEYSATHGFRIYNNIEEIDGNSQHIPYYEVRKHDKYLFVRVYPGFRSRSFISEEEQARIILEINDGIIESRLKSQDMEMLRQMVQFEEKKQKERVALVAPMILKILDYKKDNEFVYKSYILKRVEQEVILQTSWKNNLETNSDIINIELMRVKLNGNQWQIINSSLSKSHYEDIQGLLEKLENSSSEIT